MEIAIESEVDDYVEIFVVCCTNCLADYFFF